MEEDAPSHADGRHGGESDVSQARSSSAPSLERRYETILEHSPTAITTLDGKGIVLDVSQAAVDLISMPADALAGTSMRAFMGLELPGLLDQALAGEEVDYDGAGCPPSSAQDDRRLVM